MLETDVLFRFWSKVAPDPETGCWLWTSSVAGPGYPTFRLSNPRRSVYGHRLAWELTNGPVPDGLYVLHRCDRPRCVNPAHLFVGTQLDNERDKIAKGRRAPIVLKERCVRGHSFDEANTYLYRGIRHCRACRRAKRIAYSTRGPARRRLTHARD